ncbi:MAG: hypothetical protein Q7S00_01170 [bacterium]|nr:hypothetical protein [bacterium]
MSLLQTYQSRLEDIFSQSIKVAIAYHSDTDGIGSTKILSDALFHRGFQPSQIRYYPVNNGSRHLTESQEKDLVAWRADTLFYLDLCNNVPEPIQRLRKGIKFIVSLDHHSFLEGWERNFDLYLNSRFFSELVQPEKHCSTKLLNTLFNDGAHDWIEIIGLEADLVVPSLRGMPTYEVMQVLNLIGLSQQDGEKEEEAFRRSHRLLRCMLESDSAIDFLNRFGREEDLREILGLIQVDLEQNLKTAMGVEQPDRRFPEGEIYIHPLKTDSGFAICGQVLKGHFPHRRPNATHIFLEPLPKSGVTQVFLSSAHPSVDCYKLARSGGGGGHPQRAGYPYRGENIQAEMDRLCGLIEEMIRVHPSSGIQAPIT